MSVSLSLIRTGSPPLGTLGLPALHAAIPMRTAVTPPPRSTRALWRDLETRMRRASSAKRFARTCERMHARGRSDGEVRLPYWRAIRQRVRMSECLPIADGASVLVAQGAGHLLPTDGARFRGYPRIGSPRQTDRRMLG